MNSFKKNLQKFLIFFFSAVSVVIVVIGVNRAKNTQVFSDTQVPPLPPPSDNATPKGVTTLQTFTGSSYQTPWGNAVAGVQVKNGEIVAITMPQVPDSPPSIYAEPFLIDQAMKAGSANIQGVSGATYTSIAFKSSLESALSRARVDLSPKAIIQMETASKSAGVNTTPPPRVPREYQKDHDDEDEWEDDD